MVSLHIETARFKSPGHKNELCFFRNTLMCTTISKFQGVLKRKQVLNNIPLPLDHFFSTLCLKRHFRCLFVLTPLFKTPFYQGRVN